LVLTYFRWKVLPILLKEKFLAGVLAEGLVLGGKKLANFWIFKEGLTFLS